MNPGIDEAHWLRSECGSDATWGACRQTQRVCMSDREGRCRLRQYWRCSSWIRL